MTTRKYDSASVPHLASHVKPILKQFGLITPIRECRYTTLIMMISALARLLQLSTANILLSDSASAQVRRGETGFNNSCLGRDSRLNRAGPREFDCAQWVIESTDMIWNMYRGGWCYHQTTIHSAIV